MIQKKIKWYNNKKFLVSLIGVFIIGLMILSSLNVFETKDTTNTLKYKNYIFYKQTDQWISTINNQQISFFYNPLQLENVTLPYFSFSLPKMYIAYDPADMENEKFVVQRAYSILQYSNIRPVLACYNEKDCPDIPIIDCSKDDSLYIKYSNNTNIYIQDKCLVVEGNQDYQLKYLDKIFYNLLGI